MATPTASWAQRGDVTADPAAAPTSLDDLLERLGHQRPAWQADAACLEHPELPWVPRSRASEAAVAEMRAVCAACLVRVECDAYAVELADEGDLPLLGVWAGTTEADRRARSAPRYRSNRIITPKRRRAA